MKCLIRAGGENHLRQVTSLIETRPSEVWLVYTAKVKIHYIIILIISHPYSSVSNKVHGLINVCSPCPFRDCIETESVRISLK